MTCLRAAHGKGDGQEKALQEMQVAFRRLCCLHITTAAVEEEDCEHIVSLLVDQQLDSGREASALTQHAVKAFDAGAVCALRLIPHLLLQQSATDLDSGAPLCLYILCDHLQMAQNRIGHSAVSVCADDDFAGTAAPCDVSKVVYHISEQHLGAQTYPRDTQPAA
jgi:hypothetical protein